MRHIVPCYQRLYSKFELNVNSVFFDAGVEVLESTQGETVGLDI